MINENYIVSVPYRGYSFFNHFTLRIFGTCLFNIVSVPYRGYSFFNEQLCQAFREWLKTPFPSLTGVIRFLITEFIHVATAQDNVSVPYRGYSFFNPTLQNPHDYLAQNAFCGAKLFLIGNR